MLPRLRIVNVVSLKLLFASSPVWNVFLAISTAPVSIVESASGSPPFAASPSGALDSTALDNTLFDSALLESALFDSTTLDSTALVSALFVSIALDSALFGSRFDRTTLVNALFEHRVGQCDVRRIEIGQCGIERVVRQDNVRQNRVGQRVVRAPCWTGRRWTARCWQRVVRRGRSTAPRSRGRGWKAPRWTARHSTARRWSARCSTARCSSTRCSTARYWSGPRSTARRCRRCRSPCRPASVPSPFFTSGPFASGFRNTCVVERVVRRVGRWAARRNGRRTRQALDEHRHLGVSVARLCPNGARRRRLRLDEDEGRADGTGGQLGGLERRPPTCGLRRNR